MTAALAILCMLAGGLAIHVIVRLIFAATRRWR